MSDRRAQIIALLDARYDGLPEPTPARMAAPGFVHRTRVTVSCPDCLANDRVLKSCETCGGRGTVEVYRTRDPYAVDVTLPFGFDPARHEGDLERDRQIAVLEQQTSPPKSEADLVEEANAHPYAWERQRRRMYQLFDFAALDRALEQLHGSLPGVSPYSDRGLAFLDERLPTPLRAPAEQSRLAMMVGRDVAIRRAIASGRSSAKVAEDFGLSVSQVNRIVARREERAA